MAITDPTIELYGDDHALGFTGFPRYDAAAICRSWNEWYDRYQKEAKAYTKCRHKAEIAAAANQYEL